MNGNGTVLWGFNFEFLCAGWGQTHVQRLDTRLRP